MFQKTMKWSAIVLVAMVLGACASKKKTEDVSAANNLGAVENTPMNFDPAGSDSGQIEGLRTIFFDYDKATITASARRILEGNVEWMKANANVSMQIEGHCDVRGSLEYNLALGERRALAVKSAMEAMGISGDRLSVISYGKEKLLDTGDSERAHARNRRANFVPLNR